MWPLFLGWGGPWARWSLPVAMCAALAMAITPAGRSGRGILMVVALMLIGYYSAYLISSMELVHLVSTTYERLIMQVWPAMILAALSVGEPAVAALPGASRRGKLMVFTETPLGGAFVLDVEERHDSRGLFARTYCRKEFEDHGLEPDSGPGQPVVQPPQGHAPRHALPVSARGRDQAGPMYPWRHPRRDRGPAAGVAHLSAARVRGADRRQPPQPLRAPTVCPRLPGAGGRHRGGVPDGRVLRARSTTAACRTTIRGWRSPGPCRWPTCPIAIGSGHGSTPSKRRSARAWRRGAGPGSAA